MTVSAPEFDPELTGHSALVRDGVCHALTTEYDTDIVDHDYFNAGYPTPECDAHDVTVREESHTAPRSAFADDPDVTMCPDCWPEHIADQHQQADLDAANDSEETIGSPYTTMAVTQDTLERFHSLKRDGETTNDLLLRLLANDDPDAVPASDET